MRKMFLRYVINILLHVCMCAMLFGVWLAGLFALLYSCRECFLRNTHLIVAVWAIYLFFPQLVQTLKVPVHFLCSSAFNTTMMWETASQWGVITSRPHLIVIIVVVNNRLKPFNL